MIEALLSAVRAAAAPTAGVPADAPPPGRVVRVSDDAPAPAHMVVYSDAGRYRHSAISSACAVVSDQRAGEAELSTARGALALRAALRESDLLDIAADAGAGFDTPAEVRGL